MPEDARDDEVTSSVDAAVVIRLTRSGGMAGVRRAWLLVSDEQAAWDRAIDACPWDDDPGGNDADRFIWRVEVRAPLPERRAVVPESALDGPWRELVERVRDEGEAVRPPEPGR